MPSRENHLYPALRLEKSPGVLASLCFGACSIVSRLSTLSLHNLMAFHLSRTISEQLSNFESSMDCGKYLVWTKNTIIVVVHPLGLRCAVIKCSLETIIDALTSSLSRRKELQRIHPYRRLYNRLQGVFDQTHCLEGLAGCTFGYLQPFLLFHWPLPSQL